MLELKNCFIQASKISFDSYNIFETSDFALVQIYMLWKYMLKRVSIKGMIICEFCLPHFFPKSSFKEKKLSFLKSYALCEHLYKLGLLHHALQTHHSRYFLLYSSIAKARLSNFSFIKTHWCKMYIRRQLIMILSVIYEQLLKTFVLKTQGAPRETSLPFSFLNIWKMISIKNGFLYIFRKCQDTYIQ